MIFVPRDASDQQVLDIVREWVDVLAREDYEAVFAELGYSLSYGEPGGECIRKEIKRYRSPEYYSGIEEFTVTDWKNASGGNPSPQCLVSWFKPNSVGGVGIRGAVSFDLPLNGRWSDLTADFVFFQNENLSEGYPLALEQIQSSSQFQREVKDL
jgi:hypothetical protein